MLATNPLALPAEGKRRNNVGFQIVPIGQEGGRVILERRWRRRGRAMKQLILNPRWWECTLLECPPGHFVFKDTLCFKSEYRNAGGEIEAFNEAGEYFWGGAKNITDRENLIVQPVLPEWKEVENANQ
jgi:hypothetical protein